MAHTTEMLLRRMIRGILQESQAVDLSGKSLSKVAELVEINQRLRDAGLDIEVGLATSSGGNWSAEFSLRSVAPRGDATPIPVPMESVKRLGVVIGALSEETDSRLRAEAYQDLIEEIPYGSIRISRPNASAGLCMGAMTVDNTARTKNGWGPLLYDLAMEWASSNAGGLMSGRSIVDYSAQAVWRKYDTMRGDVTKVQLDVRKKDVDSDPAFWGKQLTPTKPDDDCDQFITGEKSKGGGDWKYSPLSRAYKKIDDNVTRELIDAGLLW